MKAPATDQDLVKRCMHGDAVAMRQLVERFQQEIFGLSVKLLRHRQDAEDVTQEVFLRAFRSLHTWDSQRPLRPWILTIAVNRCRTLIGKRSRRPESLHLHEEVASPKDHPNGNELYSEIQAALADLREDYRTAFILFHEQSLPCEQIAASMDRPIGTIKTWLHRARSAIFDRLQSRGVVDALPEARSTH